MHGARWIVASMLCAACGRPDGAGGGVRPTGSATSVPPALPADAAIEATRDPRPQTFESWWGESPMGLQYAVARTDIADRIFFVLSGSPITCAVFDDPALRKDTVDLQISHILDPDGTWKWVVTGLGHERAALGPATMRGSTDRGKSIEVAVDVSVHSSDQPMAIAGTIAATVCARSDLVAASGADRVRRSTATMTLAGQRFAIAGARLKPDHIELSTERGGDCFVADERVEILQWTSGPSTGKWGVVGTWIDHGAFITASGPTIAVGATRTVAGRPVADLTLAGGGRIGPWSLAIDGAIEADVCVY